MDGRRIEKLRDQSVGSAKRDGESRKTKYVRKKIGVSRLSKELQAVTARR